MEEHVVLSLEKYDEMKAQLRAQSARIAELQDENEFLHNENTAVMGENTFLENAAIGLAKPHLEGTWKMRATKQELIDENVGNYAPSQSYKFKFCDHISEEEFKDLVGRVWERKFKEEN